METHLDVAVSASRVRQVLTDLFGDRRLTVMAENSSNGHFRRLTAGVALAKDLFAFLRDSSLFAVALLLLVFPATFNAVLTSAGFEEGSFAGLKWKRQFYDT